MSDPTTRGVVLVPERLAAYQEGSVVSRTLVKGDAGSVTLFAFARGQSLSEHTAPFDALVHLIDGRMEIVISGKPHRLSAGEMILMPAGEPHSLQALEGSRMILTMIRG